MRVERRNDTTAAAARELLGEHDLEEHIALRAAVGFVEPQSGGAQLRGRAVQRSGEGAGFVPFIDEGRDLAADERAQRGAELLVFGGEVVRQHRLIEHRSLI